MFHSLFHVMLMNAWQCLCSWFAGAKCMCNTGVLHITGRQQHTGSLWCSVATIATRRASSSIHQRKPREPARQQWQSIHLRNDHGDQASAGKDHYDKASIMRAITRSAAEWAWRPKRWGSQASTQATLAVKHPPKNQTTAATPNVEGQTNAKKELKHI
jgi:hypothetical protein